MQLPSFNIYDPPSTVLYNVQKVIIGVIPLAITSLTSAISANQRRLSRLSKQASRGQRSNPGDAGSCGCDGLGRPWQPTNHHHCHCHQALQSRRSPPIPPSSGNLNDPHYRVIRGHNVSVVTQLSECIHPLPLPLPLPLPSPPLPASAVSRVL